MQDNWCSSGNQAHCYQLSCSKKLERHLNSWIGILNHYADLFYNEDIYRSEVASSWGPYYNS